MAAKAKLCSEKIEALFEKHDFNKDGTIDYKEIRPILCELGVADEDIDTYTLDLVSKATMFFFSWIEDPLSIPHSNMSETKPCDLLGPATWWCPYWDCQNWASTKSGSILHLPGIESRYMFSSGAGYFFCHSLGTFYSSNILNHVCQKTWCTHESAGRTILAWRSLRDWEIINLAVVRCIQSCCFIFFRISCLKPTRTVITKSAKKNSLSECRNSTS